MDLQACYSSPGLKAEKVASEILRTGEGFAVI
jgi:hypothetical protein